ncbi:MAG: hypothetical protein H0T89_27065 [Deltaproteobacteria bacterium]|nr:hypothetical protein [Deltaproteobacteria bacterium]MDQ3298991.1 hypothetical protein [Myxococcota bacterium]
MGRTALYRDLEPWKPARAEVQLEPDALWIRMPDGRQRRHELHGCAPMTLDGYYADVRHARRFVRMLVLERHANDPVVVITPPDQGAVAPHVVRVPEAPPEAAIVDGPAWTALADWIMGGGRLSACAIVDLARLATIASSQFAMLIGEVAAQRALELWWATPGPLRGGVEIEISLQPLADAARHSPRAGEALVSALSHAAGVTPRRRR